MPGLFEKIFSLTEACNAAIGNGFESACTLSGRDRTARYAPLKPAASAPSEQDGPPAARAAVGIRARPGGTPSL